MNTMKNIILLKNLPSNLVEEAIVVLKENTHIQKCQMKELEERNRTTRENREKNEKLGSNEKGKNEGKLSRNEKDDKVNGKYQQNNIEEQGKDNRNSNMMPKSDKKIYLGQNNVPNENKNSSSSNNKGKCLDNEANDYIIKEAEMVIQNYLANLEMKSPRWKNNMKKLERKYKNSVKLNFVLSFTTLIGILFIIL